MSSGHFQTVSQVSQFVKVSRVIELISIFGFYLKVKFIKWYC